MRANDWDKQQRKKTKKLLAIEKVYSTQNMNLSTLKRIEIDKRTSIFVPLNADENEERAKYQSHVSKTLNKIKNGQ